MADKKKDDKDKKHRPPAKRGRDETPIATSKNDWTGGVTIPAGGDRKKK